MKTILTRNNCTKDEAIALTSRVSAWHLFSGKVDHLVVNYHERSKNINFKNIEFDISECYRIAAHSVKQLINKQHFYFDDIVSEAVTRFLETSGDQGSAARLWSLARYTAFDFMKRKLFKETELIKLSQEYFYERLSN